MLLYFSNKKYNSVDLDAFAKVMKDANLAGQ